VTITEKNSDDRRRLRTEGRAKAGISREDGRKEEEKEEEEGRKEGSFSRVNLLYKKKCAAKSGKCAAETGHPPVTVADVTSFPPE
jgi:hypothetical protein